MPRRTGNANGPIAPWKHKVKEQRRLDAEKRQKVYDAKSLDEKLKYCGVKEKAKLLKRKETNG